MYPLEDHQKCGRVASGHETSHPLPGPPPLESSPPSWEPPSHLSPLERQARIFHLIDCLRRESGSLIAEAGLYRHQRDEFQRKLEQQLEEVRTLHQAFAQLRDSQKHVNAKHKSEVARLRSRIRLLGGENSPSSPSNATLDRVLDRPDGGTPPESTHSDHHHEPSSTASSASKRSRESTNDSHATEASPPAKRPSNFEDGFDWACVVETPESGVVVGMDRAIHHGSVVCCLRFSADGARLAAGCENAAFIYDVRSGQQVEVFRDRRALEGDSARGIPGNSGGGQNPPSGPSGASDKSSPTDSKAASDTAYIRSICFSPNGRYLVTGGEDRTVKVWDVSTRAVVRRFTNHEFDIYGVDFCSNDRHIVSGSGDMHVRLWDVSASDPCVAVFGDERRGPTDGVTSVFFSPSGDRVLAGSLDCVVRLWDTETQANTHRLSDHTDSVFSVAYSPDGATVASASLDRTVKVWDPRAMDRSRAVPVSTLHGHADYVLAVAYSQDSRMLVTGAKDREVRLWDLRMMCSSVLLRGHQNSVISVAHSPVDSVFATGTGHPHHAVLWRLSRRRERTPLQMHAGVSHRAHAFAPSLSHMHASRHSQSAEHMSLRHAHAQSRRHSHLSSLPSQAHGLTPHRSHSQPTSHSHGPPYMYYSRPFPPMPRQHFSPLSSSPGTPLLGTSMGSSQPSLMTPSITPSSVVSSASRHGTILTQSSTEEDKVPGDLNAQSSADSAPVEGDFAGRGDERLPVRNSEASPLSDGHRCMGRGSGGDSDGGSGSGCSDGGSETTRSDGNGRGAEDDARPADPPPSAQGPVEVESQKAPLPADGDAVENNSGGDAAGETGDSGSDGNSATGSLEIDEALPKLEKPEYASAEKHDS